MTDSAAVAAYSETSSGAPPSTEALDRAKKYYSELPKAEDPDSSFRTFVRFMVGNQITMEALGKHLDLPEGQAAVGISSGLRTAFYNLACTLHQSRLRIPQQTRSGQGYEQQLIHNLRNNAVRVAAVMAKAEITFEESGYKLSHKPKITPAEAYRKFPFGPDNFAFEPDKTLDGSVEFFYASLTRVFSQESLPEIYAALGLSSPAAPTPEIPADPVPAAPSPLPDQKAVVVADDDFQKAEKIYWNIAASQAPGDSLRGLMRMVLNKKISFADLARIEGLSGEALFIRLASFERTAYFRIVRDLLSNRRSLDHRRSKGDKNGKKFEEINRQIAELDEEIMTVLNNAKATPKECGIENDPLYRKWNPGRWYMGSRNGQRLFALISAEYFDGNIGYFEESLREMFRDDADYTAIHGAYKDYLPAPAPEAQPQKSALPENPEKAADAPQPPAPDMPPPQPPQQKNIPEQPKTDRPARRHPAKAPPPPKKPDAAPQPLNPLDAAALTGTRVGNAATPPPRMSPPSSPADHAPTPYSTFTLGGRTVTIKRKNFGDQNGKNPASASEKAEPTKAPLPDAPQNPEDILTAMHGQTLLLPKKPADTRLRKVQANAGLGVVYVMTTDKKTADGFVMTNATKIPKPKKFILPGIRTANKDVTGRKKSAPAVAVPAQAKPRGRPPSPLIYVLPPEEKTSMERWRETQACSGLRSRIVFEFT